MKRAALLATLVLLPACSQESVPAAAKLSGTYDLALVGDLLFVTSADQSELRVLDLTPAPRDFVRAPNPIESLSIPVVDRPIGMDRDVHYDNNGAEVGGPYVYAHSSAQAISVVGASRDSLKEIKRLTTPGPVSALSARGPDGSRSFSRLYYATSAGDHSNIWQVDLPEPGQLATSPEPSAQLVLSLPGEFVSALLVLPAPDSLVVATRTGGGHTGRTFLLNTTTGAETSYQFPGPVRMLVTHPKAEGLAQATRVFGVLDEGACGVVATCHGILAVDAATGALLQDGAGLPMLPISLGRVLPLGLTFASGASVLVPSSTTSTVKFSLLGIGTASDGRIFFFDALALRMIDGNVNPAYAYDFKSQAPGADPGSLTAGIGLLQDTVKVVEGAGADEQITLTYQGPISGLVDLVAPSAGDSRFLVGDPQVAARAQPGDIVQLSGCQAELTISTVSADAFDTATPVPAACAKFTVRASGDRPFTVEGRVSGYMGRTGPLQGFTFQGTYFNRPPAFTGAPQLQFSMGHLDPAIARGWRYLFQTATAFAPLYFRPDPLILPVSFSTTLPGSVVHLAGAATAFVAYPSGNGILEFSPPYIIPNSYSVTNIKAYQ